MTYNVEIFEKSNIKSVSFGNFNYHRNHPDSERSEGKNST